MDTPHAVTFPRPLPQDGFLVQQANLYVTQVS